MRFMGGKARTAKHIVPFINALARPGRVYMEPFLGGCNILPNVTGYLQRWGSDADASLIALWRSARDGWIPPEYITKDIYDDWRYATDDRERTHGDLYAFIAYGCSFGGKKWGGYARNGRGRNEFVSSESSRNVSKTGAKLRNYAREASRGVVRNSAGLGEAVLIAGDYRFALFRNQPPFRDAVVYCDPPYKGTTRYRDADFVHDLYWSNVRDAVQLGKTVLCSEYDAPSDFIELWRKDVRTSLHHGNAASRAAAAGNEGRTERLFVHRDTNPDDLSRLYAVRDGGA